MNNEEKKNFIIEVHKMYMKHRPYDNAKSISDLKQNEDYFWNNYYQKFYELLPKSFFKYRKPTETAIENFEKDTAWFSHPVDFDDTVDSTLNNDIEEELNEFKKDPIKITKELSKAFINGFASLYGVNIDLSKVDEIFPLFNDDGTYNEKGTKEYLQNKIPEIAIDECINKLKKSTSISANEQVQESLKGFFNNYMDINKKIRSESITFSLAEESDNQAMWGLYAEESKGFCLEYSFSPDDFLGQRMLLNLFPIYYGDKPHIKFFDVLIKGLYSSQNVNGISYDDYQDWFLSAYTKDKSYEFQKEWRITFDKKMGGNLQQFPFVKSIILGERMTDDIANKLIAIAKKKKIDVYRRKINKSGSKIIVEKI